MRLKHCLSRKLHCQCPPKNINNWFRFIILSQVEEGPLASLSTPNFQTQNYNDGVICMGGMAWDMHSSCTSISLSLSLSNFYYSSHYHSFEACNISSFVKLLCIEKESEKAKGDYSLPMSEKQKLGFFRLSLAPMQRENPLSSSKKKTPNKESKRGKTNVYG